MVLRVSESLQSLDLIHQVGAMRLLTKHCRKMGVGGGRVPHYDDEALLGKEHVAQMGIVVLELIKKSVAVVQEKEEDRNQVKTVSLASKR